MTSLININNIDITYPVAGQDNDTQGFRTNFQNIRNNFVTASREITDLQSGLLTTQSQAYGNTDVSMYLSNYNGGTISSAIIVNLTSTGTRIDAGYQYYAPTTNFEYIVNNNVYRFIMDPSGAITNGNVLLPSANVDATVIRISSTQNITNFKVTPNLGTTLVPSANISLAGGTSVEYFYHAVESKWYKVI